MPRVSSRLALLRLQAQAQVQGRTSPRTQSSSPQTPDWSWAETKPEPTPRPKSKAAPIPAPQQSTPEEPHPRTTLWSTPIITLSPSSRLTLTTRSPALRPATAFFSMAAGAPRPKFLYSAPTWRDQLLNHSTAEVCFLGCSNAGKSTLLSAVLGVPGIARASATPGFTKSMNAFGAGVPPLVASSVSERNGKGNRNGNDTLSPRVVPPQGIILMDTPGYGHKSIRSWGDHIATYLERRARLRGVFLLLRADVPLTKMDEQVLHLVAQTGRQASIVLTRADRCREKDPSKGWVQNCMRRIEEINAIISRSKAWNAGQGLTDVVVSAAGMYEGGEVERALLKKAGFGMEAGIGGVRIAVLRMAGILDDGGKSVESAGWGGEVVPWEEIV